MFFKRKTIQHFSPIVNKENTDFKPYSQLELQKTNYSSKFTFKSASQKRNSQKALSDLQISAFSQNNQIQAQQATFITQKKFKNQDNENEQCFNHKVSKKSLIPKQHQKISFKPKRLQFLQDDSGLKEQDKKWNIEVIEVIKCDQIYKDCNDFDDQIERWDKQFTSYDIDSDKENRPPSDRQYYSESDSEEEQVNYEKRDEIKVIRIRDRQLYLGQIQKELDEIKEVDETTSSNCLQIRNGGRIF